MGSPFVTNLGAMEEMSEPYYVAMLGLALVLEVGSESL